MLKNRQEIPGSDSTPCGSGVSETKTLNPIIFCFYDHKPTPLAQKNNSGKHFNYVIDIIVPDYIAKFLLQTRNEDEQGQLLQTESAHLTWLYRTVVAVQKAFQSETV